MPRTFTVVWLFLITVAIQGCKHPLVIVGEGDIVDVNNSGHGCTLEQYQTQSTACTENEVTGDYSVNYKAEPRAGWRFVRWEGACSPASDFQHCQLDVSEALLDQWKEAYPNEEVPPSIAVFQPITGETGYLVGPGSVVAGVSYQTPTQQGVTGLDGSFQYTEGETIRFLVGDTFLGEVPGSAEITPFDLAGSAVLQGTPTIERALADSEHPFHQVINTTILLQTLDHDANAGNGVEVRQSVANLLSGVSLDLGQYWRNFSEEFEFRRVIGQANTRGLFSRAHGAKEPARALQKLYKTLGVQPQISGVRLIIQGSDHPLSYGEETSGSWQYDDNGYITRYEGAIFYGWDLYPDALYVFEYNARGNLKEYSSTVGAGEDGLSLRYDAYGNLIQRGQDQYAYDAYGSLIRSGRDHYSYDADGRLVQIEIDQDGDGKPDYTSERREYDDQGQLRRLAYWKDSRSEPETEYLYQYDDQGNLTRHEERAGEVTRLIKKYEYDDQGNLTRYEEYQDHENGPPKIARHYEYTDQGKLTRFQRDSFGEPWKSNDCEYDQRGNLIKQRTGSVKLERWKYNQNNNLVQYIVNFPPFATPYGKRDEVHSWDYNARGKLIARNSLVYSSNSSTRKGKIRYGYDDRDNLARRITAGVKHETWNYDQNNNLEQYTVNYPPFDLPYGEGDQVRSTEYDVHGNLLRKETVRYSSNGAQTVDTAQYEYTGWGHIFFDPLLYFLSDYSFPSGVSIPQPRVFRYPNPPSPPKLPELPKLHDTPKLPDPPAP